MLLLTRAFSDNADESAVLRLSISDSIGPRRQLTNRDLYIKDAFLVFRALCKLTMKALNTESERDLKSHAMRSKLLSLHLVLSVLDGHVALFVDPASIVYSNSSLESNTLLQASKQYLLLSLSRNAVSTVHQVFEISVEVFWRVLSGMRTKLKVSDLHAHVQHHGPDRTLTVTQKEIEVLLNEIFLPILEMRNSTAKQKSTVMSMVNRLCQDPQALVEIYLNYDCDSEALQNIYERLMNIVSKIGATAVNLPKGASESPTAATASKRANLSVASVPPSLTTAALGVNAAQDAAGQTPAAAGVAEARLKRQGLDCLVSVLRSLVQWGTSPGKIGTGAPTGEQTPAEIASQHKSRTSDENSTLPASNSNMSIERLSPAIPDQVAGSSTSSLSLDDPGHFESAKLRKTALLEGIKKFNFKPKRVRHYYWAFQRN